jgi:predicted  nucleic acid-binding Zn-ribbon protein
MELTVSDIEQDIQAFEARISAARQKLAMLPEGHLPLKEHKKREQVRRDLVGKVHHIKTLIRFANEGIEILKNERG